MNRQPIVSRRDFEIQSNIATHGIDWAYSYEYRKLIHRGVSAMLAHATALGIVSRFA